MIPLRLRAELPPISEPVVVRLRDSFVDGNLQHDREARLVSREGAWHEYDFQGFALRIEALAGEPIDGDVVLLFPQQSLVHRLVRADSKHNTFLVTERCDQLCVMCSQPPKRHHVDHFDLFERAAELAPQGATLGISGGEPTLYKERLFALLVDVLAKRPDLHFHVLTNAQHFTAADSRILRALPKDRVLWGVPLYAPSATDHDAIVGKDGAFATLMRSFGLLLDAGAMVELRTVVTARNVNQLASLARVIATDLSFCARWAVMQLEPIGFGRMNWDALFFDNSTDFRPIARAVNIALASGIDIALFNFPLCTIPQEYRGYAPSTISDWKLKYLPVCHGCSLREHCGGFFEWYDASKGFTRLGVE